jgi:hypothetical protein
MSHRFTNLVLLAVLGLGLACNASARQDKQSVVVKGQKDASNWIKAESAHFIVFSDARQDDVFQLLKDLEKLDHVLRIYTRDYYVGGAPGQKMTLYYNNSMGGFNKFARNQPEEAVGMYSSCASGVLGFGVNLQRPAALSDAQLAKHPLDASLSYMFEAYTRHFLYRHTDIRTPAWFIEGFSQYFSSVRFSDKQMVLGRPPVDVTRYLRFVDKGNRTSLEYADILEPQGAREQGHTAQAGERLDYMAKSWNLMHYMLSTSENRDRLSKYLELTHSDVPAAKAIEDVYGLKAADLGTAMWRYRIKGITLAQVNMPALPSARINISAFPDASTNFVLADAALKSCPGQKEGESLLRRISEQARGVNSDIARLTLSRAQIDWGNPADALPYLTEAAHKSPASYDANYLLGLANLRLAEREPGASGETRLKAARQQLAQARSLDPSSAEAAFAFYQAGLNGNGRPDEATLDGAIAAWRNAHEVNAFARSAALAFAYAGRAAEADNALTLLAHNTRDPVMASWATAWQSRLAAGVGRAQVLAEMRRDPGIHAAFREWTVAGENLMKTVEHNAGVDNARSAIEQLRLGDPGSERVYSIPQKKR